MEKKFDCIVIGSGLTGLIIGSLLKKKGQSVAILEKSSKCGGTYHRVEFPFHYFSDNGFCFIEDSQDNRSLLKWLSDIVPDLSYYVTENKIVTYQNGNFVPFKTFGSFVSPEIDEIMSFLNPYRIKMNKSWFDIISQLETQTKEFLYLSHVAFLQDIKNDQCILKVNNSELFIANSVFYTGNFEDLIKFLPNSLISSRFQSHLNNPKLWTAVLLEFYHPQIIQDSSYFNVFFTDQSENENICLGFFENINNQQQKSQWIALMPDEDTDDPENISKIIKKMKKQIKKSFSDYFNANIQERIVVFPSYYGTFHDHHVTEQFQIKKLPQIYLAMSQLSRKKGALRFLDVCSHILSHSS